MTAITLATFRDRVRRLGGYESSGVITDAILNEHINDAIGEYADMLNEEYQGYRDTTATLATVANTATVALPASFLALRALDLQYNGIWRPLTLFSISQTYGLDRSTGYPVGYMHVGTNLELFPTPDAVYSLRLRYVPAATVLVGDTDAIDIPNGWEKFILYTVLAVIGERDERDTSGHRAIAAQIRERVREAAKRRNTGGPEYVPIPGEGQGWP